MVNFAERLLFAAMTSKTEISHLRQEYSRHELSEESADKDPFIQFSNWFAEAINAEITEPNAMSLGTCGADLQPSVRIVLLKGFDEDGFVFFTNYNSDKGRQIEENPKAALTFLWLGLERQVRIEGHIEKVSAEESDIYFHSRPLGSRLGAWSSPQSREITKYELIAREAEFRQKFENTQIVPRPDHWGGYRVVPVKIEFWQGRPSRMHDRIVYLKLDNKNWQISRLAP